MSWKPSELSGTPPLSLIDHRFSLYAMLRTGFDQQLRRTCLEFAGCRYALVLSTWSTMMTFVRTSCCTSIASLLSKTAINVDNTLSRMSLSSGVTSLSSTGVNKRPVQCHTHLQSCHSDLVSSTNFRYILKAPSTSRASTPGSNPQMVSRARTNDFRDRLFAG